MAYEPKSGDISVFKNSRKEKDTHPDYTGKAIIDGETYYVSFWIKNGDKGAFFSGKIEKKRDQQSGNVVDPLNPGTPSTPPVDPLDEVLGPLEDNSPAPSEKPKRTKKETEEQAGDLPF